MQATDLQKALTLNTIQTKNLQPNLFTKLVMGGKCLKTGLRLLNL